MVNRYEINSDDEYMNKVAPQPTIEGVKKEILQRLKDLQAPGKFATEADLTRVVAAFIDEWVLEVNTLAGPARIAEARFYLEGGEQIGEPFYRLPKGFNGGKSYDAQHRTKDKFPDPTTFAEELAEALMPHAKRLGLVEIDFT